MQEQNPVGRSSFDFQTDFYQLHWFIYLKSILGKSASLFLPLWGQISDLSVILLTLHPRPWQTVDFGLYRCIPASPGCFYFSLTKSYRWQNPNYLLPLLLWKFSRQRKVSVLRTRANRRRRALHLSSLLARMLSLRWWAFLRLKDFSPRSSVTFSHSFMIYWKITSHLPYRSPRIPDYATADLVLQGWSSCRHWTASSRSIIQASYLVITFYRAIN